ncbi:LOW QUALITY PROTEIN: NIPA-like protein 2 [Vidua macroura]|uniref:LOW QUALITY PROTEIN: NIPA-like protein 2 n=1 Tax=Vidua macroura TaxID=187451 RepID=UPI0023A87CAD|nr:LOW QUALITY PROTEIN: NIPA-like protein 2 [Vidua macroura]
MDIIPGSWNASFGGPGAGSGPLSGPWYSTHKTQLFGVLLAAASNFVISVSLNIQKCAHLRLVCQAEQKPCYTSKLWWCGITLLGLGEVGNFTAYGFAPIALVAPLGCVSVIGSAFISVFFLKKTMRTADILGGTLTITGIYLLVTFTPNVPQELTARQVQNYLVSWPFLVYSILEILIFCILLYFYKRKAVKHIMVLLMMVALLASLTVIAVKAVSSMIALSVKGKMQLTYSVFYIMSVLMATSCAFQIKFLNQAMHLYEATAVVPINFVFFTTSAIISGVIFYREFQSAALLSMFMFLFGCLLSFLGVIIIARNKKEELLQIPFIDCGHIPGQKLTGKIQPDSHCSCYGTLNKEDDLVKRQS